MRFLLLMTWLVHFVAAHGAAQSEDASEPKDAGSLRKTQLRAMASHRSALAYRIMVLNEIDRGTESSDEATRELVAKSCREMLASGAQRLKEIRDGKVVPSLPSLGYRPGLVGEFPQDVKLVVAEVAGPRTLYAQTLTVQQRKASFRAGGIDVEPLENQVLGPIILFRHLSTKGMVPESELNVQGKLWKIVARGEMNRRLLFTAEPYSGPPLGSIRPPQAKTGNSRSLVDWTLHAYDKLDSRNGSPPAQRIRVRGSNGSEYVSDILNVPTADFDLVSLNLHGIELALDDELQQLKGLEHLEELNLMNCGISDGGLVYIKELKSLTALHLRGTLVTDEGLSQLSQLAKLQILNLSFTRTGDAGLAKLSGLPELTFLNLENTLVTDAGIASLRSLKKLGLLNVKNTRCTMEGLLALKAHLPGCRFER